MNQTTLWSALALVVLIAILSVVANRVKVPSPIVMLAGGIAVALIPHLPRLQLEPEFVLMVLLPPLLYTSGVGMSWRGFRSNLRPILLLAIGCVLFTAAAVAAVAHYVVGTTWAVGFVLGAVVSPPDAVAPMAILRRLLVPRRILTVLEGESLVNDATALVLLSFAVAALTTGTVSLPTAGVKFLMIVVGEIGVGIAVGWTALRLRHLADDPRAELMLSLATPFAAFWPPHLIGGSGVIACVTAGLFVSWNGRDLIRPATRLQGFFFWGLVVWSVEALVFLLTGIATRSIVEEVGFARTIDLLRSGMLITLTVVVMRFVWVFPATYLPRAMSRVIRAHEPFPNWRVPFLVSFTGLRGVVSLAAALSVPIEINGIPLPDRALILVVTFAVIASTLVVLGGLLPRVIHWLKLDVAGQRESAENARQERAVRRDGIKAVLEAIENQADSDPSPDMTAVTHELALDRLHLIDSLDRTTTTQHPAAAVTYKIQLIDIERNEIAKAYLQNRLTDEARRRIERELDLEEARVRHAVVSLTGEDKDTV